MQISGTHTIFGHLDRGTALEVYPMTYMISQHTQWCSRGGGGAKGEITPPFFKENALGVEQSVTS